MAIATRDALIAALAAGQRADVYKVGATPGAAGRFMSLFRATGRPSPAANPATGSGNVCTAATPGAMPLTNPVSGAASYLAAASAIATQLGTLVVMDRLVETSGLSGIVTTAQTVNSVALPRYTTGVGVSLFLEVTTALGATASAATVSYTNQDGATGRTGTVVGGIPASAPAGLMMPVQLQQGDTGVRSVQTVTAPTSTGTAGSFGVTLAERLLDIPLAALAGTALSWADTGMPVVVDSACVALAVFGPNAATTVDGAMTIAQG